MAIIAGFRSTSVWKAFILNSLVASLVIVFAVLVKEAGEKRTVQYKDADTEQTVTLRQEYEWSWSNVARTIASAFLASMLAYTVMHFLFGYGGGLLVDT